MKKSMDSKAISNMRSLFTICSLLVATYLSGQPSWQTLMSDPLLRHASIGLSVVELSTGKTIHRYNDGLTLIPASTLKLFTAVSALHDLGSNYRYQTICYHDGYLDVDGTLAGNLYFKASGDPTLGSDAIAGLPSFDELIQQIIDQIATSITCIDGGIIVVDDHMTDLYNEPRYWLYEDVGNYYGAPARAFNIRDNAFDIYLDATKGIGNIADLVKIYPAELAISLKSDVRIDAPGTGDQAYILGGPSLRHRQIVGTIPSGGQPFKIKGSMPAPARFFEKYVSKKLQESGIAIGQKMPSYGKVNNLFVLESPPLKSIVQEILQQSNNLYTEAVARQIPMDKQLSKWIEEAGGRVVDACGLSPVNRISAGMMTNFLYKLGEPDQTLLSCLPVAGVSGTIKNMWKGTPAQSNLYLKSGSMTGVTAYAGYMLKSGKWYALAIMVNGYSAKNREMRPLIEKIILENYNSI